MPQRPDRRPARPGTRSNFRPGPNAKPGPRHDRDDRPRGPRAPRSNWLAKGLRVVHEDAHVIVIDKPPGLLTAAVQGQGGDDVFSFIKRHVRDQAKKRGTTAWIVHRLDREASGLLVFAKTREALEWLKDDFKARRTHRLYAAVVEGTFDMLPNSKQLPSGTVQSYLYEDEEGRVFSTDTPTRANKPTRPRQESEEDEGFKTPRLAVTHYRVITSGHGRSLLQVRLETGRKHQIRIHMKLLGKPIVGDTRYEARENPIDRLCLHAVELGFRHPATGETVRFTSPAPGVFWSLVGTKAPTAETPLAEPEAAPQAATPAPTPVLATPAPMPKAPAGPTSVPNSSWDHVADWYDALIEDRVSDHHENLILPGTLRLLEPAAGTRTLDVACGQGVLCRRLAASGVSCVGIDAAERLIEHARRAGPANIVYRVADARGIASLGLEGFDSAACVMALMNIDPIGPVCEGIASALKPGGKFVSVILHPAFRAPGQTSWDWERPSPKHKGEPARDAKSAHQFRRVDAYLSNATREIVMNPGQAASGRDRVVTYTFHRPIQHYVQALAKAGFTIDAIEEWPSLRTSQPGPRAEEENRARREIPMFLAIRAVRTNAITP